MGRLYYLKSMKSCQKCFSSRRRHHLKTMCKQPFKQKCQSLCLLCLSNVLFVAFIITSAICKQALCCHVIHTFNFFLCSCHSSSSSSSSTTTKNNIQIKKKRMILSFIHIIYTLELLHNIKWNFNLHSTLFHAFCRAAVMRKPRDRRAKWYEIMCQRLSIMF